MTSRETVTVAGADYSEDSTACQALGGAEAGEYGDQLTPRQFLHPRRRRYLTTTTGRVASSPGTTRKLTPQIIMFRTLRSIHGVV